MNQNEIFNRISRAINKCMMKCGSFERFRDETVLIRIEELRPQYYLYSYGEIIREYDSPADAYRDGVKQNTMVVSYKAF